MKRIGLIGAIGALSIALLVPSAVAAHSPPPPRTFWAQVDKATCNHRKGTHGFGKVILRMQAFARNNVPDAPTPNYIHFTVWLQEKIDGVWTNLGLGHTTPVIHPDGTEGIFDMNLGASHQFLTADHPRTRLLMRVEFFDDLPTGDVRVGKIYARTEAC